MMPKEKIVILGHGGFARELAWLIHEINKSQSHPRWELLGFVVSDLSKTENPNACLGDYNWLEKNRSQWTALALGIGSPKARAAVSAQIDREFRDVHWPTLIHPSVNMDWDSCKIQQGSLLCANVIGTVNLKINEFSLINLSCTLGHESEIGSHSVINPSVNVSGGVTIGQQALIGTGAQILQNLNLGDHVTVGAGAVVTKNVESGLVVTGVPAQPRIKVNSAQNGQ
jgi:sugar O-acyltransferase (sialic acid O-acetyltransferase NeuD family)